MKKRILSFAAALCMAFGAAAVISEYTALQNTITANAEDNITNNDYEYATLYDGTIEITKYNGSDTDITIPEEIDGYKVSAIGKDIIPWNTMAKRIVVPEGVTDLRDEAFASCSWVETIVLPDSLKTIGNKVFYNCHRLAEVNIPESVETIGYGAFENCYKLTSIKVPESVTYLGASAFSRCSALSEIDFKASINVIMDSTFYHCGELRSISLSDGITIISKRF